MQALAATIAPQTSMAIFRPDRTSLAGFGIVIALHAAVILLLFNYAPAREALRSLSPLMVELIKPAAPPAPKPAPRVDTPPKPLPVKRVLPQVQPQILAAQAPSAPVAEAPVTPEPRPALPIEARPAPPVAPAAPLPVVPPSFNVDYLDNPAPAYPSIARRMGEQGRVLLRVYVEASGLPASVEVRTSSGSERLDAAALEAVRRWKFVPARQGERAVAAYVVVPIVFSLRS